MGELVNFAKFSHSLTVKALMRFNNWRNKTEQKVRPKRARQLSDQQSEKKELKFSPSCLILKA